MKNTQMTPVGQHVEDSNIMTANTNFHLRKYIQL